MPNASNVVTTQLQLSVLDSKNIRHPLTTTSIQPGPIQAPVLVLNGYNKNQGARVVGHCNSGMGCSLFGYYVRTTISVPMSVKTMIGHMSLSYQTISFNGTETRVVSNTTPTTFLISNHTTTSSAIATLGPAEVGTVKAMLLVSKHPSLTPGYTDDGTQPEEKGNITIVPNSARFPGGVSGPSQGRLVMKEVGDSALLIYSGEYWMILGTGCTVQ